MVGTLVIDQFPTRLFSPSLTYIFSYVCFLQTNNVIFSLSEICKHIDFRLSFDRSSRTLTENNRRVYSDRFRKPYGKSVDRSEIPWHTHTHRAVHSVGITQLGCDMGFCMVSPASPVSVSLACFPFMFVLPGESRVSDLVRLGVASRVHCSKSNFVCFPWTLSNCLPLFTSSLFFLLSRACFLPLTLVFLVTDNCLAVAFWLDSVPMACRRSPAGDPPTGPRHRCKPRCRTSRAGTEVPCRWRPGG